MPSESKTAFTVPTEKPNHYSYLKEFRVDQCSLFVQHKCTQHRPFTCFYWHFNNQRRRRPVRKRDGTFNYSADNYCSQYDETTGQCPDGDDCPYLHRTAGDTERRYHLRYYKTCLCVHDTDNRGFCAKNGAHCAFAHGNHDLRPAVHDIKELQIENGDSLNNSINSNGLNVLDRERSNMSEDPKWQDTAFILAYYKTEACKRPPRLCRQGYACPHFHNIRDKRRNPRLFKYRSTPCPNVKHGEDWGETSSCESGDECAYCHTRTEQQFHPEIYKSTKCNDVQQSGYCPRGAFCAFAHLDEEMTIVRDMATALESGKSIDEILESMALNKQDRSNKIVEDINNESSDTTDDLTTESETISSNVSESSLNKAPGSHLTNHQPIRIDSFPFSNTLQEEEDAVQASIIKDELELIERDILLDPIERAQRKQGLYEAYGNLSTTNSQNGILSNGNRNSIDLTALSSYRFNHDSMDVALRSTNGLQLDDTRDFDSSINNNSNNSITTGFHRSGILDSVSIPNGLNDHNSTSQVSRFSPVVTPPLLSSNYLISRFQDPIDNSPFMNSSPLPNLINAGKLSTGGSNSHFGTASPLLYDSLLSPSSIATSTIGASSIINRSNISTLLNGSVTFGSTSLVDDKNKNNDLLRREAIELQRKLNLAEKQRDEAMNQLNEMEKEKDKEKEVRYGSNTHTALNTSELKKLSLSTLKKLQKQTNDDLEKIKEAIYYKTQKVCFSCGESNRNTIRPCNHVLICTLCTATVNKCPYCEAPITSSSMA